MDKGKERFRITFICPVDNLAGGMRVIAIYAERLAQRGHRVTVVLPSPNLRQRVASLVKRGKWLRKGKAIERSYFRDGVINVRRLDHSGPVRDRDVPDADLVIATWWETAEWVYCLSPRKGAKLHFMQDNEVFAARNNDELSRINATSALPIPKIVIAQWVWELLQRRWRQTPVALVPNSVETDKFFGPQRGQTDGTDCWLYLRYNAKQGCRCKHHSHRAGAPGAIPTASDFGWVLAGLRRKFRYLLGTEFHFNASDEKLRELYASCDAWLFGTRIEGFGLPILESMACRTPVVGTAAGAAPELIKQGGGILVAIEDTEAMAEAIVKLARMSETEWRRMSDAAYRTATEYSWDDATDKFEAAVKSVITQRVSTEV